MPRPDGGARGLTRSCVQSFALRAASFWWGLLNVGTAIPSFSPGSASLSPDGSVQSAGASSQRMHVSVHIDRRIRVSRLATERYCSHA